MYIDMLFQAFQPIKCNSNSLLGKIFAVANVSVPLQMDIGDLVPIALNVHNYIKEP